MHIRDTYAGNYLPHTKGGTQTFFGGGGVRMSGWKFRRPLDNSKATDKPNVQPIFPGETQLYFCVVMFGAKSAEIRV